jgi:hypothetical protein
MGRSVLVEITECGKHSMKSNVLDDNPVYPLKVAEAKKGEITGLSKTVSVFSTTNILNISRLPI